MSILVIGSSGFVGRNLCLALKEAGNSVIRVVSDKKQADQKNNIFSVADILETASSIISDIDVVINLASKRSTSYLQISDAEVRFATYTSVKKIITKVSSPGTLVINTSTYIQNHLGIPGKTVDTYSTAKQELSSFLQEFSHDRGVSILDLFLFTLYGEGDNPNHLVPILMSAAKKQTKINLSPGNQLIGLTHISDIVQNYLSCLKIEASLGYKQYYLWDTELITVKTLVKIIEEVSEVEIPTVWGSRSYSGHEMLTKWPNFMERLPNFKIDVELRSGLLQLWNNTSHKNT